MGAANTATGTGRHVAAVRLGKVYGPAIGEPGEAGVHVEATPGVVIVMAVWMNGL